MPLFICLTLACGGGTGSGADGKAGANDGRTAERVPSPGPAVTVEYVAHAAFRLRDEDGNEVLIDPFASRVWLGYDWPGEIEPDAILITHPHYDHDAGRYRGMPFPWDDEVPVIDAPGEHMLGAFAVSGVEGKHADPYGKEFGQLNTLMLIEAYGVRIAHLGDNGPLTPEMVSGLGRVDVLMLPADGVDHILSQEETAAILDALDPRFVVPMHYRLPDLEPGDGPSDLGDIEPWLDGRAPIRRVGGHTFRLSADGLPDERTYLVFEHAPYVAPPA